MNRLLCFILILILRSNYLFAQFVQLNTVNIFPLNPTNVDSLYLLADVTFDQSNCDLISSYHFINNDTLLISSDYCVGSLSSYCNRIDTISIGTVPSGNYTVVYRVNYTPVCLPSPTAVILWSVVDTVNIGVFTGLNRVDLKNRFNIYPNPTNNSKVNIASTSDKPFQVRFFNSLGELVFERFNLIGNQHLELEGYKGLYFVVISDVESNSMVFKIINQ